MYLPPAFKTDDLACLHEVIRRYPLATLVTKSGNRIAADHIPFLLDTTGGNQGVLRAHVARANPLWQVHPADAEALVIFTGPDHYITPSWYVTKHETGKAVPTWNYVTVHAYGLLRVFDDAVWLRQQIEALTARHEAGHTPPWSVTDAPDDFIAAQMKAIVGIEIAITHLEGKLKISQNRPQADQAGVIAGLTASSGPNPAHALAQLMTQTVRTSTPDVHSGRNDTFAS